MAQRKEFQTTPFTIAHYILLFMIVVVCASIVTWLIIARHNATVTDSANITKIMNDDPCVQQTRNAVSRMWAYNQELIPVRYKAIAETYANNAVLTRVHGYCNDVPFTCRAGQLRRTCDPCAVGAGRNIAMELHIADMIRTNCGYEVVKK